MADKVAFWTAIRTLAGAFREEDPQIIGKLRELVTYFNALPHDEQVQLRLDVQLLSVQFSKLAWVMTTRLDAQERQAEDSPSE